MTVMKITETNPDTKRNMLKRYIIRSVISFLIISLTLFISAGNMTDTGIWLFVFLMLLNNTVGTAYLYRKNPELLYHRLDRIKKDYKKWDGKILILYFVLGVYGTIVICGLDVRFGWSSMGWSYMISGSVLFILSIIIMHYAMAINPHFEVKVRIQHDRGHQVIREGPYSCVRHPGYASGILFQFSLPMIIGSIWAFIPAVLGVLLLFIRAYLEDRLLKRELQGYIEYSSEVKYRLIPGLW